MIKILTLIPLVIPSLVNAAEVQNGGAVDSITIQWLLNATFTIISILAGWLMHLLHETVRDLHITNMEVKDKVHTIELLVAGQYVRKEELKELSMSIFQKLDRIEQLMATRGYKE